MVRRPSGPCTSTDANRRSKSKGRLASCRNVDCRRQGRARARAHALPLRPRHGASRARRAVRVRCPRGRRRHPPSGRRDAPVRRRARPRPVRVPDVPGPPKPDAAHALARLTALGVEVKVITGDNDRVAAKVCGDLGLPVQGMIIKGEELDGLDDAALAAVLPGTTVFARVTPEQKSRVIKAQRGLGRRSASSGTASTTLSHCTTRTSASPSTARPTSPRTPPTSSFSTRTRTSWRAESARGAGSSRTR